MRNLTNQNPLLFTQQSKVLNPSSPLSLSFPSLPSQFSAAKELQLQLEENMGGGRGFRSRTQRKHFRENRENVWKRSKSDPESQEQKNQDGNSNGDANPNPSWQPLVTENPHFEEYYKVIDSKFAYVEVLERAYDSFCMEKQRVWNPFELGCFYAGF